MATAAAVGTRDKIKEYNFLWVGQDKRQDCQRRNARRRRSGGQRDRCAGRASRSSRSSASVCGGGGKITEKDITLLHPPARDDDEIGRAAAAGLRHRRQGPLQSRGGQASDGHQDRSRNRHQPEAGLPETSALFRCAVLQPGGAGEQAGILDSLLDRLATYKEKILAIKSKIKSALFYPIAIIVVAFIITAVIMIFVIPAFKQVFASFGADLPAPTLIVMAISDFFVEWWWAIFGGVGGGVWFFFYTWKRSVKMQMVMDRLVAAGPDFRRARPQGDDRALDAHALDHVRRRRAAGGGARFGGRRRGQLRILRSHQEESSRRSARAPA